MRIVLLTHYYAPEFGAPQRRWGSFVRRFIETGHEITVFAPPPHYPSGRPTSGDAIRYAPGKHALGDHGETVIRVAYSRHRGDLATRTLDHAVAAGDTVRRAGTAFGRGREKPDVLIATSPAIETLIAGSALARRWRVPLVAEMRDAWPDLVTYVESSGGHAGRRLGSPVHLAKHRVHQRITAAQRRAAAVVTTTEGFADVLRARGIDAVHVIRNGTDVANVPVAPPPSDDHPGLRAVYLGNLGRSQGLDTVVRAAALLRDRGVQMDVRMIGHGALAGELAALARELAAPVRVSTRIPHSLIHLEYAWSDTAVVSLRDWEPFSWTVPSKLYEVLGTGRHITGILAGEAASVVRAARAGDLVVPGDVEGLARLWARLAENRDLLRTGSSGRAWVAEHADDDALASAYLDILEKVVQGAGTRRP